MAILGVLFPRSTRVLLLRGLASLAVLAVLLILPRLVYQSEGALMSAQKALRDLVIVVSVARLPMPRACFRCRRVRA